MAGQKQDTKTTFDGDDIDDNDHEAAIYDYNDDDDNNDDDDIEGAAQSKQDSKPNHEVEGRTF